MQEYMSFLVIGGLVAFALMVILLPFSAYSAQKWAAANNKELRMLNQKLDAIANHAGVKKESDKDTSGY